MMIIGEKDKLKKVYFGIINKDTELKVVTYDRLEFNSTISILEIQNKDSEKINGIKFLEEYLSISYKDIVYFGDAENDISVFNEKDIHKVTLKN